MTSQPGEPEDQAGPVAGPEDVHAFPVGETPAGIGPDGPPANGSVAPGPDGSRLAGDASAPGPAGKTQSSDTGAQANGFQAAVTALALGSAGQGDGQAPPGDAPPLGKRTAPRSRQAVRSRSPDGRQRRWSVRATGDRAVATLEAAELRRAVATAAADLLWTRPPARPTRYWLSARLSDMGHGWLDGRRGLPRLPGLPEPSPPNPQDPPGGQAPPGDEAPIPPTGTPAAATLPDVKVSLAASAQPTVQGPPAVGEPPSAVAPTIPPAWLQTPRMRVLWAQARELMEAEEEACIRDCSAYLSQLRRFQKARDIAAVRHEQALADLALARCPLTEIQLLTRRGAEHNEQDHPESLVRFRRQVAWERRLARAVQEANTATAQLADATREAELRNELRCDRTALAQTAAHRHHEFYLRRTATYLQQLVRTHKQGRDLNMLLMHHQVGPLLPEWTRKPPNSDERSSP